jgi:ArsR family transcriptional regulator
MAVPTLATVPIRRRTDPCCQNVMKPSLTTGQATKLANQLKAVGDATRLRMLDLLVQQSEPICVCDITPLFDQLQPTISHHLRLLREAGLIDTEKRGLWAYYWATQDGRATLEAVKQLS